MSDELTTCAAAFFRSKGKTVVTENEFLMGISIDLHWMPHKDAKMLLSSLISNKILKKDGEYLRPVFELSSVDVPVAYKPDMKIIKSAIKSEVKKEAPAPENIFPMLVAESSELNIEKRDFISECNMLQKKLNIDIEAAGLIVLRNHGLDISEISDSVYNFVLKK